MKRKKASAAALALHGPVSFGHHLEAASVRGPVSLVALALALGGCSSGAPAETGGAVEATEQAVFHGTLAPAGASRTGVVRAVANINGCTATLVAPNWLLTAAHCINSSPNLSFVATIYDRSASFDGTPHQNLTIPAKDIYGFTDVFPVDAALLKLPVSVPYTPAVLFSGGDANIVGKAVTTYGYGWDDLVPGLCNTSPTQCTAKGTGWFCDAGDCKHSGPDLRFGNFVADHITRNGEMQGSPIFDGKYLVVPPNPQGQYTTPGDSGGPTFVNDGSAFHDQLVGVTGGGHWRAYAKLFRDWVSATLANDAAGVLHPPDPLQFDWGDMQRVKRVGDFAPGKWKAECRDKYVAAGLSVDQNASTPGAHAMYCRHDAGQNSSGSSAVIDFGTSDHRRSTSSGDWDPGYFKGECAANEAITGLAQTITGASPAKSLTTAVCSPFTQQPSGQRTCSVHLLDGSSVGVPHDGWAYDWDKSSGHQTAMCPANAFMSGVSAHPTTGRPHAVRCCYDFRPQQGKLQFANVDGGTPRKADLIALQDDRVEVQTSTGGNFNAAKQWLYGRFRGSQGTFFADVTGDGLADAITSSESGIRVRRSTGSGFSASQSEVWSGVEFKGKYGIFFADVTGDGRADAIVSNDFGVTVRRSDGTRFLANEMWISTAYLGSRGTFFADVTGDGRADAIVSNDFGVTVRRSDGTQFLPNETWISGVYSGSRGTFFKDVTGDGKADAIVVNDFGVTVRRSNGSLFQPNEDWTGGAYIGQYGSFFEDVTGDGKADAIVVNDFGITIRRSNGSTFNANEAWSPGI